MLAHAETLQNLHNRIASRRVLTYGVAFKIFAEIRFAHDALPASKLVRRRLQISGLFKPCHLPESARIGSVGAAMLYGCRSRPAHGLRRVYRLSRDMDEVWSLTEAGCHTKSRKAKIIMRAQPATTMIVFIVMAPP
jgi:hypothetical protein